MAKSTSEVGHAVNVRNFADLINFCISYGAAYNPNKNSIKLDSLQSLLSEAKDRMNDLNDVNGNFIRIVNERQQAFAPLSKLSTRILNALDASDVHDNIVRDARTIVMKVRGNRSNVSKPAVENEVLPAHSTSQMSFDQRIENFSMLIALLKNVPEYTPNETELQVDSLSNYLQQLRDANSAHSIALVQISNTRNARDVVMYNRENGVVKISSEVKKYLKSLYGSYTDEFTQVRKLKFVYSK